MMRNKLICLWLLLTLLTFPLVCFGQEAKPDQETIEVCNKFMLTIYEDILENKNKHKELEEFDENSLNKNKYGIYKISYKYSKPVEGSNYEFIVTILGINEELYEGEKQEHFRHLTKTFPNLGLRVAWSFQCNPKLRQYNIVGPMNFNARILNAHEVKYSSLPPEVKACKQMSFLFEQYTQQDFQITIATDKKVYKDSRNIRVHVRWKNISDKPLAVEKGDLIVWRFHVLDENGKHPIIYDSFSRAGYKPKYLTLEPNEIHESKQKIPELSNWELDPGKYYIKKFKSDGFGVLGGIESNTVEVEIAPSTFNLDRFFNLFR
ncbi:hypothetical protein ACFL96_17325 [Thermoproteota archaeon]